MLSRTVHFVTPLLIFQAHFFCFCHTCLFVTFRTTFDVAGPNIILFYSGMASKSIRYSVNELCNVLMWSPERFCGFFPSIRFQSFVNEMRSTRSNSTLWTLQIVIKFKLTTVSPSKFSPSHLFVTRCASPRFSGSSSRCEFYGECHIDNLSINDTGQVDIGHIHHCRH